MEVKGKDLPNLKICIDNTDDLSDLDADIELAEETNDNELEEGEIEDDDDDVEVSVSIPELGPTKDRIQQERHKYANRDGAFVTGIDVNSKDYLEKKAARAKRFGIKYSEKTSENITNIHQSLGVSERELGGGERGIRQEAIHLRGLEDMSTKDVFNFFKEFSPGEIEWIDDGSCNVLWTDSVTPARALAALSRDPDDFKKKRQKKLGKKNKEKVDESQKEADGSEKEAVKQADTDDVEMDSDVDLNLDSDTEDDATEKGKDKQVLKPAKKDPAETDDKSDNVAAEDSNKQSSDSEEDTQFKWPKNFERLILPPGKWRIGCECPKTRCLYLRLATKADRKQPGAEKRSQYYQKYGNPNYGGITGLISGSRKRRLRATQNRQQDEEVLRKLREAMQQEAELKSKREMVTYDDLDPFSDAPPIEETIDTMDPPKLKRPKKQKSPSPPPERKERKRTKDYNSDDSVEYFDESELYLDDPTAEEGSEKEAEVEDDDFLYTPAEVARLIAPEPEMRSRRMHADDEEEKIITKRKAHAKEMAERQLLNDARHRIRTREQKQATFLHDIPGSDVTSESDEDVNEEEYIPVTSSRSRDLRARLGNQSNRTTTSVFTKKKNFLEDLPSLTIEVNQDDDYF
ncbi:unnamed protein product [Owenia fusiformis]|uniref:Nuclear cap-binding protein subunit 3 n=1 Tax=Owenia fusiformis TaxID=6347 RepID=A0A8J1TN82_OWEFU|nr:unnamed protein product [Owenia fusiformis]